MAASAPIYDFLDFLLLVYRTVFPHNQLSHITIIKSDQQTEKPVTMTTMNSHREICQV